MTGLKDSMKVNIDLNALLDHRLRQGPTTFACDTLALRIFSTSQDRNQVHKELIIAGSEIGLPVELVYGVLANLKDVIKPIKNGIKFNYNQYAEVCFFPGGLPDPESYKNNHEIIALVTKGVFWKGDNLTLNKHYITLT